MSSVASEINIICIGQHKANCYINSNITTICHKNSYKKTRCFYGEDWNILKNIIGVWYNVYPKERDNYQYDKEFFGYKDKRILAEEYTIDLVKEMISYYLNESPYKMILFMVRLDQKDYGANKNYKIINENMFIKKLINGELLFDRIYFIKK